MDTITVNGKSFTLGRTAATDPGTIPVEIWRHIVEDEKETARIVRVAGRPVAEIAQDLARALEATQMRFEGENEMSSMIDEYVSVAHEYKYNVGRRDDTPPDWVENAGLECTAVRGGSEGHYVHVYMVVPPPPYTRERAKFIQFLTVKTFRGFEHAWKIAARATELLGFGF